MLSGSASAGSRLSVVSRPRGSSGIGSRNGVAAGLSISRSTYGASCVVVRPRLLTTFSRIEVTRVCSGRNPTGDRCAKHATTARLLRETGGLATLRLKLVCPRLVMSSDSRLIRIILGIELERADKIAS